jgi:hypothetical protein
MKGDVKGKDRKDELRSLQAASSFTNHKFRTNPFASYVEGV